jgi:hypothetical protein
LYRFLAIIVLLDVKDIPQVGPLQWGRITSTFAGVVSDTTGHKLLVPSYVYWLIAIGALLFTAIRIQMELDEQKRKSRKLQPVIELEALVTRLAGGSDLMPSGIGQKTLDALINQLRCGRVVEERVRAIGGDQLDAQGLQLREADLLDHYVAPVIWVTDAIPFVSYLTRGQ